MTSIGARVRMSPDQRREQLLDIGVRLLAGRPLEELSIELLADEAGISRGLLYHYFGNKHDFHVAVVRRAAAEVYDLTAPVDPDAEPVHQLIASLGAYLDYVSANSAGYRSLVRAAAGGDEELRQVYLDARRALTDRVFDSPAGLSALGAADTPATRLLARGWAALVEDLALAWIEDPAGLSREQLLLTLAGSLTQLVGAA